MFPLGSFLVEISPWFLRTVGGTSVKFEDSNLVLKYFDLLDEFIRVRVVQDMDLGEICNKGVRNKSEYRSSIIHQCLPDFGGELRERIRFLEEDYDPLTVEDLLYQICIDVNPGLEIHQVCLPAGQGGKGEAGEKDNPLTRKQVANLEKTLRREVIGQDDAVDRLARAVKKAAIGLKRPGTPIGTFLFVGRTGTGKTEMAKALTEALFGEKNKLIRIDCSEFALPHEYAKLIGSPPGYIGHSEGGVLTEAVKNQKTCVILFDEIEKAHSKVHNLLLQILDEGRLTDSKGETVTFKDCLILMTSNLGVDEVDRIRSRMGFDLAKRASLLSIDHASVTREALKESFRPEFLNRIDEIVVFHPLNVEVCCRIASKMLSDVSELLARKEICVRFSAGLKRWLAEKGFSEEYGARELRRLIKREVEDRLADEILENSLGGGDSLFARLRGGKVSIEAEVGEGKVLTRT